ncbi:MAG: thiamine phosphate synthase [Epsilonproteobacteria bacterium]|nr:thiamine phosphate synthase [Campylobacterota bacterium]
MIRYAITSPLTYNRNNPKIYFDSIKDKADFVLYRDLEIDSYPFYAKKFIEFGKNYPFKLFLHQDISLAKNLGAFGIHLKSTQIDKIKEAKEDLFVIVSTHSIDEVLKAQEMGANMVTFSPIFYTPNKGEPKGIEKLKEVIRLSNIPIIALGGIVTPYHIKAIKDSGAAGFASIRYFNSSL